MVNPKFSKNISTIQDGRGCLSFIESTKDVPFEIRRIYYIFNTLPNQPRGFHAHKECVQFAICLQGSCEIKLEGKNIKESVVLNSPQNGCIIDKHVWHEMHHFSHDCILLILADRYYEESDYIRSYDEFSKLMELYK